MYHISFRFNTNKFTAWCYEQYAYRRSERTWIDYESWVADHVLDVNPEALRMSNHGIMMHFTTSETNEPYDKCFVQKAINSKPANNVNCLYLRHAGSHRITIEQRCHQCVRVYVSQTALCETHLVLGCFIRPTDSLRPFFNSRRGQSKRSDFALIKTCDETGRCATPICLLFLRG